MISSSWLQQITWRPASHDWYTTGKSTNFNRPQLKRALITGVVLLSAILFLRHGLPSSRIPFYTTNHSPSLPNIPRKIWQTWHRPASALGDDGDGELKDCVTSWTDKNPHHRYELLTDYAATQWVHESYIDEPKVIETWDRIDDAILRADLVRYLLMLKEGGVYTDVDTCATRPISAWIAPEYANTTRCVIGLEEDKTQSPTVVGDYPPPALVGICQWTLMAAPGHPLMRFVVNEVVAKLLERVDEGGKIVGGSANDVLSLTGPDVRIDKMARSHSFGVPC